MINDNFGAPNLTTIEKSQREHERFLRGFFRKRKNINWSILTIFLVGFLITVFVPMLPIFAVKYRLADSSFDGDLERQVIEDYYKDLNEGKTNLPFSDFDINRKSDNIEEELEQQTEFLVGDYGVYVKSLETGEEFGINKGKYFTMASLSKLFVSGATYKEIQEDPELLEKSIPLKNEDKVGGHGDLIEDPVGSKYTVNFLVEKMLNLSDNTAFAVMTRILGIKYINRFINEIGLQNTSFERNTSTPYDIGTFLEKVYKGEFLNSYNQEEMLMFMQNTAFEDRLPYYLPKGVKVAHKVGTWEGAYSDAGIVFADHPYIIVVMTDGANHGEAVNAMRKISQVVYYHFNQ